MLYIQLFERDILDDNTLEQAKQLVDHVNCIICDMAPEFSGIKKLDVGKTATLNFQAFEFAKELLSPNGNFVCKSFQGARFNEFMSELRKNFKKVTTMKPNASRKESGEIYIIAMGFSLVD